MYIVDDDFLADTVCEVTGECEYISLYTPRWERAVRRSRVTLNTQLNNSHFNCEALCHLSCPLLFFLYIRHWCFAHIAYGLRALDFTHTHTAMVCIYTDDIAEMGWVSCINSWNMGGTCGIRMNSSHGNEEQNWDFGRVLKHTTSLTIAITTAMGKSLNLFLVHADVDVEERLIRECVVMGHDVEVFRVYWWIFKWKF